MDGNQIFHSACHLYRLNEQSWFCFFLWWVLGLSLSFPALLKASSRLTWFFLVFREQLLKYSASFLYFQLQSAFKCSLLHAYNSILEYLYLFKKKSKQLLYISLSWLWQVNFVYAHFAN